MKITLTVVADACTIELDGGENTTLSESPHFDRLMTLKTNLKNFARVAPVDKMSCAEIQRAMLQIANEEERTDGKQDPG